MAISSNWREIASSSFLKEGLLAKTSNFNPKITLQCEVMMAARIYYADLWGRREGKYQVLTESDISGTGWAVLKPTSPFYLFVPIREDLLAEYERGWKITDIFPVNSVGIVTSRDHFVIDFDATTLKERISSFRETASGGEEVKERFKLEDKQGWSVADARKTVRQDSDWEIAFTRCLYRPFDIRYIFYHKAVIERTRSDVMRHMLAGENFGMLVPRQIVQDFRHIFCTKSITNFNALDTAGRFGSGYLIPLYLYPAEGEMQITEGRQPNLSPAVVAEVEKRLGERVVTTTHNPASAKGTSPPNPLSVDGEGAGGEVISVEGGEVLTPEDIFNYAYAVFHSPTYRTRYAEFLKIDFPRLPLTSDKELFTALGAKGAELVPLHLMDSPLLNNRITRYPTAGSNMVEKVSYDVNSQRVYINKTQYFEAVPPEVWDFHIGGYQVAQKWLKDRKDRTLTYDELTHYQKVMVALKETIRLMGEIDQLIPGWPIA